MVILSVTVLKVLRLVLVKSALKLFLFLFARQHGRRKKKPNEDLKLSRKLLLEKP